MKADPTWEGAEVILRLSKIVPQTCFQSTISQHCGFGVRAKVLYVPVDIAHDAPATSAEAHGRAPGTSLAQQQQVLSLAVPLTVMLSASP